MPKSMQSSRLSAEAQLDFPDPTTYRGRKHASVLPISGVQEYRVYKGEGPNRVVVLDEEEAMQEKMRRRAGLSDDTGSDSLMMQTQSAGRRPCADG